MKNTRKINKNKKLAIKITGSVCAIGFSASLVFGLSAGLFKINYVVVNAKTRSEATILYESSNIKSSWCMDKLEEPKSWERTEEQCKTNHQPNFKGDDYGLNEEYMGPADSGLFWDSKNDSKRNAWIERRYEAIASIIDGNNHVALDRSFNQDVYLGCVRWIFNDLTISNNDLIVPDNSITIDLNDKSDGPKKCLSFKPSMSATTYFRTIFNTVASRKSSEGKKMSAMCLPGFNFVTPLNTIGHINDGEGWTTFDKGSSFGIPAYFLFDGVVENIQNLSSFQYRADESAFLTGLATCYYFLNNLDYYHNKNNKVLSIGIYGGVALPTVANFMGGIQRGLELFNTKILTKIVADKEDKIREELISHSHFTSPTDEQLIDEYQVKSISLGNPNSHFSGTFLSGDGTSISKQLLNRGASAILAVAGPQTNDTVKEVKAENSNAIVIGVDSALEESDYQTTSNSSDIDKTKAEDGSVSEYKDKIIKFSAIKNLSYSCFQSLNLLLTGRNYDTETLDPEASICSIGYKTNGNLLNGCCGITYSGWYYAIKALSYLDWYENEQCSGNALRFSKIWEKEAKKSTSLPEKLKEYHNILTLHEDISTKEKKENSLYTNLSDATNVLGKILNSHFLNFDDNDWTTNYAGDKKYSTVINWLTNNMYFLA